MKKKPDLFGTAGIPISTPIPTVTNLWRRYATGQPKKAKTANKPTTSTATKSTSHARLSIRTAIWFGDYYGWGKLKSETNVTGLVALSESDTCTGKCQEEKKRKKCLDATVDNIKMVTAKTSYLTLQKAVSIPAVARYNQTL